MEPMQAALAPGGEVAARIAVLGWWMFGGAAVIFVLVMALTALAIRRRPAWLADRRTIVIGGIAFPVAALSALLVYGLRTAAALDGESAEVPLRIEVIGEQYWWRVHYLDELGVRIAALANEIHIPTGRTVELALRTEDVIHSFWVPNLAGKLDMIPGRTNHLRLSAVRPGVYRGQCAEYCGAQHALMAFYVVAVEPERFGAWLAAQRRPATVPADPLLLRGRDLVLAGECVDCHTIRGTPAAGTRGPDLTHVGSRLSIGAGSFPNNAGTLAGWIASSQHLKPGNPMPSFDEYTGRDLRALAAYLESLK